MDKDNSEYRAYLLRLWREGNNENGWRASLEDPHSGHLMRFATVQQLYQFLDKTMRSPLWEPRDDEV
jgi:hypothetical protein